MSPDCCNGRILTLFESACFRLVFDSKRFLQLLCCLPKIDTVGVGYLLLKHRRSNLNRGTEAYFFAV